MSVVIETTIGDITVDLFTEIRPVACLNFIKLCKLKYYNYNLFHTVEQGFIAQTGDPSGAGDGGSSVWGVVEGPHKRFFEGESLPKIHHSTAGLLSLVSAGKNLCGSQFFFTLADNLTSLDGIHCVIGEVVEGHETLRLLNDAIVDEKFRPFQDIRITHTVILDDPFPDPRGFQVPERSPSPSADRLQNGRIAADEDIDDTDGMSMQEIQEMLAEREAKARATILEIVGDLPDAEMAPPENVLFVCKLNPVTTDDDLEIIFSRFGKVKQCEVIRDKKTGDSLQYAFVEFEEQSSCEAAYFKMDNVLIDDRRIHVDFSQSVSRVKWRGKGRGVEVDGGRLDFNNLREPAAPVRRNERRSRERRESPQRNGRADRSDNRGRMTSEERRRAREQRHREQDKEVRSRNGRRSRSLTPRKDDRRRYDDNRRRVDDRRVENRDRKRDASRSPDRRRVRSRSRSRDDRRRLDRDRSDRRRQSPERRPARRSPSPARRYNEKQDRKRGRHEEVAKKPAAKSKRSSDSDDSAVSESEDSESDSDSSSHSTSSSEDNRRKKKKTKKSKRDHKSKSSKKKSKKHRR